MLEVQMEKLKSCRDAMLTNQFVNEDYAKEILFNAKDLDEEQVEQRRNFLTQRLENRKNLYIYPEHVNA